MGKRYTICIEEGGFYIRQVVPLAIGEHNGLGFVKTGRGHVREKMVLYLEVESAE